MLLMSLPAVPLVQLLATAKTRHVPVEPPSSTRLTGVLAGMTYAMMTGDPLSKLRGLVHRKKSLVSETPDGVLALVLSVPPPGELRTGAGETLEGVLTEGCSLRSHKGGGVRVSVLHHAQLIPLPLLAVRRLQLTVLLVASDPH